MKLYSYYRSSASYRVRIALNLKQLGYETKPIHLVNQGGEQFLTDYTQLNPQALVPTLDDSGVILSQSLAILEYLEETYPQHPLLPSDNAARAQVRAMMQLIACEVHPLNNLRVLKFLKQELACNEDQKNQWYQHWITEGFTALEKILACEEMMGLCCYGDTPTFADCCLIPQVYNAQRFNVSLGDFPMIKRINNYCLTLEAFQHASPEVQPDAPRE